MKRRNIAVLITCIILGSLAYATSPYAWFTPLGSDNPTAEYGFALVYTDPSTHQNVTFGNEFVNLTGTGGIGALNPLTMRVYVITNKTYLQPGAMYFEPSAAYQLKNGALVPSSFGPPKFANITLTHYANATSEGKIPHTYWYWRGNTTLEYYTAGTFGGFLVIPIAAGAKLATPIVAYMPNNAINIGSEEEGIVARQSELTTSLTLAILLFAVLELRDEGKKTGR